MTSADFIVQGKNIRLFGMIWTYPSQLIIIVSFVTFYKIRYDLLMLRHRVGPKYLRKFFNTDLAVILICILFMLFSYVALLPINKDPETIVDPFFYLAIYIFFCGTLDMCMLALLWKRGIFQEGRHGKNVAFEACTLTTVIVLTGLYYLYLGNTGLDKMLAN